MKGKEVEKGPKMVGKGRKYRHALKHAKERETTTETAQTRIAAAKNV